MHRYTFAKCCHYQQTTETVIEHTAWCQTPLSTETYKKEFDSEKDMQEYVHEKYMLRIHNILRE